MKYLFLDIMLLGLLLSGCSFVQGEANADGGVSQPAIGSGANVFNPYMNDKLPQLRKGTAEGDAMLQKLGAKAQTIEGEAAHRKNWRSEIYPVLFGDKKAPNEIIVVLDFSKPESAKTWKQVVDASKNLSPQQCKIVVFGQSRENYGTDLMGLAIWIAQSRSGQAIPFLTYALDRWNAVKAAQKSSGEVKTFTNEYDATATSEDFPIHYSYFSRLNPPIPANQELSIAQYCYNAGNVNKYQAHQVCQYYGASTLPAIIVNGKVLKQNAESAIMSALH